MRWIVDGTNVIGSRPDGWWRDRRRAIAGLVERLEQWATAQGDDVTVVFERPLSPPLDSSVITVAHAPKETSATMRGLNGPAGIWLHSPKLAELYRPLGTYLRSGAGLSEPVREVCILATAREFNNAFEWAAHEPEALRVGVPVEIVESIKLRKPSTEL